MNADISAVEHLIEANWLLFVTDLKSNFYEQIVLISSKVSGSTLPLLTR